MRVAYATISLTAISAVSAITRVLLVFKCQFKGAMFRKEFTVIF
jgi:hypothetical protein